MKILRPYQTIAADRAQRRSLLLADQCGLGKTITGIEAAKAIQAKIEKPILIVVPTGKVKLQWLDALQEQGISAERIIWLDSSTKLAKLSVTDASVILTHYEAMRKHQDWLKGYYYSVIIADEAHRLKNRKAQRTEAIKRFRAYRRIALTGTPYDRNPADIWSILNWIDPDFFTSYWNFFNAHIAYKEVRVARDTVVKQILPQPLLDAASFARTLRPYMLARTKQEVRDDLPPRIDQYIDLEMSRDQASAYRKIEEANDPSVELADGVETSVSIVLTQILRLIQVTTDPTLLGLSTASSVKLDWVQDWLEDNPQESVIIFTRFRDTAIKLHTLFNSQERLDDGRGFKLIVGGHRDDVTANDRYIVGTISAMGEGLDLPHIDNAIFIDREWSSILMDQAIDRIHRINITNAKNIYWLRCINTVDEMMQQANESKWSTKQIVESYLKGTL